MEDLLVTARIAEADDVGVAQAIGHEVGSGQDGAVVAIAQRRGLEHRRLADDRDGTSGARRR